MLRGLRINGFSHLIDSIKKFYDNQNIKFKYDEAKQKNLIYTEKMENLHLFLSSDYTDYVIRKIKYEIFVAQSGNIQLIEENDLGYLFNEKNYKFNAVNFVLKSKTFCSCLKLIAQGRYLNCNK